MVPVSSPGPASACMAVGSVLSGGSGACAGSVSEAALIGSAGVVPDGCAGREGSAVGRVAAASMRRSV